MIYVSLISYTPDPERTNAAAARISNSTVGTAEPLKKPTTDTADHLFNHMLGSGHLYSSMPASPPPTAELVGKKGR
jgi:hypothetical protein